jgi:hypothetical protein
MVQSALDKYRLQLASKEYRKQMADKGIDIDALKKQWQDVYKKMDSAREVDESYNRLMAKRGNTQLTVRAFGRKNRRSRSRKQKSKSRKQVKKQRRSRKRR